MWTNIGPSVTGWWAPGCRRKDLRGRGEASKNDERKQKPKGEQRKTRRVPPVSGTHTPPCGPQRKTSAHLIKPPPTSVPSLSCLPFKHRPPLASACARTNTSAPPPTATGSSKEPGSAASGSAARPRSGSNPPHRAGDGILLLLRPRQRRRLPARRPGPGPRRERRRRQRQGELERERDRRGQLVRHRRRRRVGGRVDAPRQLRPGGRLPRPRGRRRRWRARRDAVRPLPRRLLPLPQADRLQPRHLHVQRGHPILQRGVQEGADGGGRGGGEEAEEHRQEAVSKAGVPRGGGVATKASQNPCRVNPRRLTDRFPPGQKNHSRSQVATRRINYRLHAPHIVWVCVFCLNPFAPFWWCCVATWFLCLQLAACIGDDDDGV